MFAELRSTISRWCIPPVVVAELAGAQGDDVIRFLNGDNRALTPEQLDEVWYSLGLSAEVDFGQPIPLGFGLTFRRTDGGRSLCPTLDHERPGDCVVRSIALVTGLSYRDSYLRTWEALEGTRDCWDSYELVAGPSAAEQLFGIRPKHQTISDIDIVGVPREAVSRLLKDLGLRKLYDSREAVTRRQLVAADVPEGRSFLLVRVPGIAGGHATVTDKGERETTLLDSWVCAKGGETVIREIWQPAK